MASSVFYKFRSQRDESRVTFDGTGISVFDLKKEIVLANNLGKAKDFDLSLYDASSSQGTSRRSTTSVDRSHVAPEEYTDDSAIIPRSTSVIVKRMPSAKPGKGKAAMYIGNLGNAGTSTPDLGQKRGAAPSAPWQNGVAMSRRFAVKDEAEAAIPSASQAQPDDEASAMAAMFKLQTSNWEETQEKMSHAVRIDRNPRGTGFGRGGHARASPYPNPASSRPLPASYVCFRCGQKGHWIQDCPTNSDREFDNKPRLKRTTGIPRSMLKTVDNPNAGENLAGVMVTPDGGYVVAQPDAATWQKQTARPKGLTAGEVRELKPSDPTLICPIDNKLFREAVKTPCCSTTYCEECIQNHLLEKDFVCPNCDRKIPSLDKLVMDKPTRTKVLDYIDKVIEDSQKEGAGEEGAGDPATESKNGTPGPGESEQNAENPWGNGMDPFEQLNHVNASIPPIQAQVAQLTMVLNNNALPRQIREQTNAQLAEYQMQLQTLQTTAGILMTAASFAQQPPAVQQQLLNTMDNVNAMYSMAGQMSNMYGGYGQQQPHMGGMGYHNRGRDGARGRYK